MLTSNWAKALEPNITEWIHEGFLEHPDSTTEIFDVLNESSAVIRFHDSFGPRIIPKSSEAAATQLVSRQKGYETVATPQIFKAKMFASAEMVRWNQYREIMDDAKDLGRSVIQTLNLFGNSALIEAFTSTSTSYGDSKPLCSTSHTRPDGGTAQSNASSNSIALNETNLEIAILALRQQLSGTGRKLNIGGGNLVLVVPEALEKEAVIITGSQLRSGTADNDLNWYKGRVNVYVNPWIGSDVTSMANSVAGSDTAWFLLVQGQHGLKFVWDQKPVYKSWQDNDTDAMYTKVYFSCQYLWAHWYGIWGSKGDGTSYSS
ncbi:MAG: hypothetical protein DRP08_04130 [Candidatus Aenigmatarchaeota archaeon]|nr:MAG: hypothetical protein DRP08_04130 [Candidatus Aenigmarchaeota archaeon]